MLERAGLDAQALECGAHWPLHQPSAQALARSGATASAVHNNCSGKHAGFLCAACAMGVPHQGYVVSGRIHIKMDDGTETEVGPGDVVGAPGHLGWTCKGHFVCDLALAWMQERPPGSERVSEDPLQFLRARYEGNLARGAFHG